MVIMPETAHEGVERVLERVVAEVSGVVMATSDYGADGSTYEELYTAASARLVDQARAAA